MTTATAGDVKVVILCGGLGTRLREETEYRPKPLVPIGERPILWHIMKIYSSFGYRRFVLALGYKGEMIKDYFLNYDLRYSDITLDLGSMEITPLDRRHDEQDWSITFVDTGQDTMTGGRLGRLEALLRDESRFLLTYGDGVSDLDIRALVDFHCRSERSVTVTGVHPLARFGELVVEGDRVVKFAEKPQGEREWINGGFFVMTPQVFDYLEGDESVLEGEPLERLAADGELAVYRHSGYWQCVDTYRDMLALGHQWDTGQAPWKRW